jgi:hypothetical protein
MTAAAALHQGLSSRSEQNVRKQPQNTAVFPMARNAGPLMSQHHVYGPEAGNVPISLNNLKKFYNF